MITSIKILSYRLTLYHIHETLIYESMINYYVQLGLKILFTHLIYKSILYIEYQIIHQLGFIFKHRIMIKSYKYLQIQLINLNNKSNILFN